MNCLYLNEQINNKFNPAIREIKLNYSSEIKQIIILEIELYNYNL